MHFVPTLLMAFLRQDANRAQNGPGLEDACPATWTRSCVMGWQGYLIVVVFFGRNIKKLSLILRPEILFTYPLT